MKSFLDEKWMRRAVTLAKRGIGTTSPNPRVGAVVVRGGRVVGEGFHRKAGEAHAEVIALERAGTKARGATLYISLEPCSSFGKTPPCTAAIAVSGIKRVVYGAADPNPKNKSRALGLLRAKGIRAEAGVCGALSAALNRPFNSWMIRRRPWVTLKLAASLDGRIATRRGDSKWITSPASRQKTQELRYAADAILVGANTIRQDNPHLDVRGLKSKRILKVILDSKASVSPRARIFDSGDPVLIVAAKSTPARRAALKGKAEVLELPSSNGRVDLRKLLSKLGQRGVLHLLVEGGGEVAASFLEAGLADEVYWFVAPKIIGGRTAIPSIGGKGITQLTQAISVRDITIKKIGPDFLFWGQIT